MATGGLPGDQRDAPEIPPGRTIMGSPLMVCRTPTASLNNLSKDKLLSQSTQMLSASTLGCHSRVCSWTKMPLSPPGSIHTRCSRHRSAMVMCPIHHPSSGQHCQCPGHPAKWQGDQEETAWALASSKTLLAQTSLLAGKKSL